MRMVSLREFRVRGAQALKDVPQGETVVLSGQAGPAFFLVPVIGDLAVQDQELKAALALASLRQGWNRAAARGLDQLQEHDIEREIRAARKRPRRK